jgi:enoyl-CoA hydratase/carnithine racemase
MDATTITTELHDRVLTITLDRPDRLNAFTVPMQRELCAAFDEVDADPEIRAVVVTGRGRGFCAGADLAGGGDSFDVTAGSPATGGGGRRHRDEGGLLTLRIFQCTKPVIAAVNGPAVGVGATMTLPMDIRLASESARFGFVFARRGLVPEAARRGSCRGRSGSTPRSSGR